MEESIPYNACEYVISLVSLCTIKLHVYIGIIPFSRLGGFCANLGSAEIFLSPKKGVLRTNGK